MRARQIFSKHHLLHEILHLLCIFKIFISFELIAVMTFEDCIFSRKIFNFFENFQKFLKFWKSCCAQGILMARTPPKIEHFCIDFKDIDLSEFLRFWHDFWCKLMLKVHTFWIKSFLPPSTSFLPHFLLLSDSFLKISRKMWFAWWHSHS